MTIEFHYDVPKFRLKHPSLTERHLKLVALAEKRITGTHAVKTLDYVFVTDKMIKVLNHTHLKHNYYTDILTFDMSDDKRTAAQQKPKIVMGEIYISIDRLKENAKTYKVTFTHELFRVMLHGLLHLVGYDDKTEHDKKLMREKEDHYLHILMQHEK